MGVDSVAINTYKNKDTTKVKWDPLPCAQPFQRLLVAWNGDVYPCCQGHNFPSLGNVQDHTIKALWKGAAMNRLRKAHMNGRQGKIPQCKVCETTMPVQGPDGG
jgi:radical SAM protein with 4Fe4S-binding SPASM domain